ncbi:nucleoside-diphosphate sugar epimerase [Candidatus Woesearchaeota archaeon]|nr:nucleoside-diphosphate sugar epimerase [Candidatus Woesearchaeota archaeon]|tara:strand:- start:3941 stop:5053 length:1113 start_codon:yes stop_codon:yes gene_type:complete
MAKVLVTGGAGFIGSFIVDELVKEGNEVVILDNLEPQVHQGNTPDYINNSAKFVKGSVLDFELFKKTVEDADVILHQAAMVGVGQSMYQVSRYSSANVIGTAYLLDILANEKHNVKKVLVAASMSSYGEGSYKCESCGIVSPPLRTEEQMKSKKWELICSCGKQLVPIPTPESKPLHPNSVYAITKQNQEQMVLTVCQAYGIPAVALRYFNVYGPRQSLSNPYTGVAAIFMSRIKNNNPPTIFENGGQSRDFVSVHDIVQANLLAMKSSAADYEVLNVGSGAQTTIKNVADTLIKLYGKEFVPQITSSFRKGDVRHCFADISKIKKLLNFEPKVSFEQGMQELIDWGSSQKSDDKVDQATQELRDKGLME